MQTTYTLRPNVTWHDGAPLQATDFTFALTATLDPELPISQRSVASQIERIDTPDSSTLVIEWKATYPFAHAIIEDDLGPFPAHLLEDVYRTEKGRFEKLPYWTTEFVGVGPYILDEWALGSHLVLKVYDGFYGGRPKIDMLTFRFIGDSSTAVANMLSGAVDGAARAVDFNGAILVKNTWESEGKKPVFLVQQTHYSRLGVQFRVPNPPEIVDARIRQGLLHAIDRQALVEVLYAGVAPVADTFVPREDVKWDWVEDVARLYPHDLRRAEQVLEESGWRSGGDGSLVNSAGEKVSVGLWASGADREQEMNVIADSWKSIGLGVDPLVMSPAQNRDDQFRVSYPSFSMVRFPDSFRFSVQALHSKECPSAEKGWKGQNRACYRSAENDAIIERLSVAIDPNEQRALYRGLVQLLTEELPELPLYYAVTSTLFRPGVAGIKPTAKGRGGAFWNVMEWDMQ